MNECVDKKGSSNFCDTSFMKFYSQISSMTDLDIACNDSLLGRSSENINCAAWGPKSARGLPYLPAKAAETKTMALEKCFVISSIINEI